METLKNLFALVAVAGAAVLFAYSCEKEPATPVAANMNSNAAPPPCDSLALVVWGDTLRVVPRTISTGIVRKGPYAGKRYWQAMLSSNNFIEPTNFLNDPIRHRVVIADTLLITEASIFHVARIK